MTSTKRKAFNPFSLDAVNFLLSDVRGALGPYLNVFLVTQQHWSQSARRARQHSNPEGIPMPLTPD